MEMVAAVKSVFARFAQFTGRAARPEFWWFQLGNWIILTVLSLLTRASGVFWVIYVIYALAVLIPSLAVSIRRLHDTDRTGWWLLIGLIPLVGFIILIVFWATAGTPGPNKYAPGPEPLVAT